MELMDFTFNRIKNNKKNLLKITEVRRSISTSTKQSNKQNNKLKKCCIKLLPNSQNLNKTNIKGIFSMKISEWLI
jgi:hypothetical protein